jgi:hypothetical protein
MDASVISEVLRQGGRRKRVGPILVNFGHGKLNPEAINSFEAPKVSYEFRSLKSNDEAPIGTAPKLDVELQIDEMVYSSNAPSVKEINLAHPYQKTFLAVRNKITNKIKLIEANTITVGAKVTPPPSTNSLLIEEEMKRNDAEMAKNVTPPDSEKKKAENRLAMNKNLVREFGQKKGKRIYEQNDRMQIDPEILNDKLSRAAMTVEGSSLDTLNVSVNNNSTELTPPCNRNATQREFVYSLENGILNKNELAKLTQAATSLAEEYATVDQIKNGIKNNEFSEFFGKILARENKEIESTNLAIAIYMEAIIKFIGMRYRELAKGPKALPYFVPMELKEKIFRLFTDEQKNVVPTTRDSATCYVIVLALIINRYCVEFSDITSSIRVKADQLKKLVMVTGARVLTDAPTKRTFIELKLPLHSFDPSAAVKKAKRKPM